MYKRIQTLKNLGRDSCFLWGARQTGKSTLLGRLFPDSRKYDLLLSDEFARLSTRPSLLREEILESPLPHKPVIIDEAQKIPSLLDEAQWLIVNKGIQFIFCGSSARKLKRGGANLLGGRALRYDLFPLVYPEIPDFDLLRALNNGLIPRHYQSDHAPDLLRSYVGDYLKEEIYAEAAVRRIPAFSRFLEASAFSNGEIVNFQNIAAECGVSGPTVKQYFQILEDTLLARFISSFRKKPKRRVVQAPKFYFFDVGLANFLLNRGKILPKSESFGKAFEHFICQEISAHSHYSGLHYPIYYWRTSSQFEVDFILGDHQVAVEIKAAERAEERHLKGIRAFREEYKTQKAILVSLDPRPRVIDGVSILPWKEFLSRLWAEEIIY